MRSKTWLDIEVIDKFEINCIACKKAIGSLTTGMQKVVKGYMCKDCYSKEWDKLILNHKNVNDWKGGRVAYCTCLENKRR